MFLQSNKEPDVCPLHTFEIHTKITEMQVQIEQDFHQKKKPQPSWKSSRGAQGYDLKKKTAHLN